MTATDILAEYRRLAERLTLPDSSRPLMVKHEKSAMWKETWYELRLDLRDGQPVVPLDLVLGALVSSDLGTTTTGHPYSKWEVMILRQHVIELGDSVVEAVLAAANAALDAREAKT